MNGTHLCADFDNQKSMFPLGNTQQEFCLSIARIVCCTDCLGQVKLFQ